MQRKTTGESFAGLQRQHLDLRAGVGIHVVNCDLQIAWVSSDGDEVRYPGAPDVDHSALVLTLSRSW